MKKTLFIALFGMLFLVACNSQNKSKEAVETDEATEQVQEPASTDTVNAGDMEEVTDSIDDAGAQE